LEMLAESMFIDFRKRKDTRMQLQLEFVEPLDDRNLVQTGISRGGVILVENLSFMMESLRALYLSKTSLSPGKIIAAANEASQTFRNLNFDSKIISFSFTKN